MPERLRRARLLLLAFASALFLGGGCRTRTSQPIASPAIAPPVTQERRVIAPVIAASDELRLAVGLRVVVAGASLHTALHGGHSVRVPARGAVLLVHTLDGERVRANTTSYDTRYHLGDDGGLPGLYDFSLLLHVAPADLRTLPSALERRLDEASDPGPVPPQQNDPDPAVDARTLAQARSSAEAPTGVVGERVVKVGTPIRWEDGSEAGEVWRDHAFAHPPVSSNGLACFDVPIDANAASLRLCFAPEHVLRVDAIDLQPNDFGGRPVKRPRVRQPR